jgi:hypothetical protein
VRHTLSIASENRRLAWISTEKDLLNISPSGGADYEMKRSGRLFHHGTLTGLSST